MSDHGPTLYPCLRYRDAPGAIEFLKTAFGFEEHAVHAGQDGTIAHAQLSLGPSILMLGSERDDQNEGHAGQGWIYVAVEDPDVHCERARKAGAEITTEPTDTDYGSREYAALDPEGNGWSFGTYRPAVEDRQPA